MLVTAPVRAGFISAGCSLYCEKCGSCARRQGTISRNRYNRRFLTGSANDGNISFFTDLGIVFVPGRNSVHIYAGTQELPVINAVPAKGCVGRLVYLLA